MASSRDTQNGPDLRDVATALAYSEKDWKRSVSIHITSCGGSEAPELLLEALATREEEETWEAGDWVSLKLRTGRLNVKTLDAAILSLLHQLDYEIAKEGLEELLPPAEAAPGA